MAGSWNVDIKVNVSTARQQQNIYTNRSIMDRYFVITYLNTQTCFCYSQTAADLYVYPQVAV